MVVGINVEEVQQKLFNWGDFYTLDDWSLTRGGRLWKWSVREVLYCSTLRTPT